MTKERFLTVRWNNLLSVGLGLPTLLFVIVTLFTSLLSDNASFIGMVVLGGLY
jgi:hypothetical protein